MKEFKRIISLAMVLILCVSLLPMNQNLLKAEETVDESDDKLSISARVFNGESWEDVNFDSEFRIDKFSYNKTLEKKYTKIQFFINKTSDIKDILLKNSDTYTFEGNHSEAIAIPAGQTEFNIWLIYYRKNPNSSSNERKYSFYLTRTSPVENDSHYIEIKDSSIDCKVAYTGDIIRIKTSNNSNNKIFDKWVTMTDGVKIDNPERNITQFTMPNKNIKIIPTYKEGIPDNSKLRNIYVYALKDKIWDYFCVPIDTTRKDGEYEIDLPEGYSEVYLCLQTDGLVINGSDNHIFVEKNGVKIGTKYFLRFNTDVSELIKGQNIYKIKVISKDKSNTSNYTLKINNGEVVKYKVTFNNNKGSGKMDERLVKAGTEFELPANEFIAPEGKIFKAWSVDGQKKEVGEKITVNGNVEVTAIWQDKPVETVKLIFEANNNTGETKELSVEKGKKYTLPKCEFKAPEGQEFKAWEVDGEEKAIGDKITIDKEITVKAIWTKKSIDPQVPDENKKHEIKLMPLSNGKIIINPTEAKEGELVTVQAVPDDGYELESIIILDKNQNLVPMKANQFTMPKGAVSIYAKFRELAPAIYPEIEDEKPLENKRHRRDWYYKDKDEEKNSNEDEKSKAEKEIKSDESKAIITIGSQTLEKVDQGIHTFKNMDSAPYIKHGRTMLPLRYLAEALGYNVFWLNETKTVVITDLGLRVEIPIDTNLIIVNGINYTSDLKPEIVNNRTMLPIANIARALGFKDGEDILWDEVNRKVIINKKSYTK